MCKFFNPCGPGTWYAVEGSEDADGDWTFFGLVDLLEREWGYFTLSELESLDVGFGLGIERDIHWAEGVKVFVDVHMYIIPWLRWECKPFFRKVCVGLEECTAS